ncbi:MAG: hypothetical protein IT580_18900 [Verrucomicrobiales bacterium]|nr:hypothetical protein [Verrucomicrobiales bacterium]
MIAPFSARHQPCLPRKGTPPPGLPTRVLALAAGTAALLATSSLAPAQGIPDYDLPPIEYSSRTPTNRISRLEASFGGTRPTSLTGAPLLRWLLETNRVPVESQVLVFSKTSLQRDLIHPRQPRSIYFSDDLYIGWVPGGLMEVTVTDPELGMVFYKLEGRDPARPLRFERDAECLSCHGGSMTRNWPGLMVRSVYPDERGEPITSAGSSLVAHDTPIDDRWGGWYVTGAHGTARHLGNLLAKPSERGAEVDRDKGANRQRLDDFFPTAPYLRPDSDIVALMVFEHQVMAHNRLCEASLRVRKWSHYQRQLQKEMGEPISPVPVGTALRVINSETERVLEALLFCEEAALPAGGIRGAGDFERGFRANRRPDRQGRSLKDLDFKTRMFAFRCSYMVYSESFAALPAELKSSVFARLRDVLSAATPPARYAHLPGTERTAIREILRETLEGYAAVDPAPTDEKRSAQTSGTTPAPRG